MKISKTAVFAAMAAVFVLVGPAGAGQGNWIIFGKKPSAVSQTTAKPERRAWPPLMRQIRTPDRKRAVAVAPKPRRALTERRKDSPAGYQPPPTYRRQTVDYHGGQAPGTIVIDTRDRFLYHVHANGKATRYGVGVGRSGFEWSGTANIRRKAEWPAWHPPASMIEREKKKGRTLPARMEGGPRNPLGARALYLYQGKRDTLYRIHGTNNPRSIGLAMSSGCIRMMNSDVTHLYDNVPIGAKVVVM